MRDFQQARSISSSAASANEMLLPAKRTLTQQLAVDEFRWRPPAIGKTNPRAGVLGITATGIKDEAYKLCRYPATPRNSGAKANALTDHARSRMRHGNIAYGFAGVAVIGATLLWRAGAPERSTWLATVHITSQSAGIATSGRF